MNTISTEKSSQLSQGNHSPSLRIVFKNPEVMESKPATLPKRGRVSKAAKKPPVVKEPLPMFNDYKFKAKDHDPL